MMDLPSQTQKKRNRIFENENNEEGDRSAYSKKEKVSHDDGQSAPIILLEKRKYIDFETITPESPRITIFSYNILADRYTSTENFPYCSADHLLNQYRMKRVLGEILQSNADIICLQECEVEVMDTILRPELASHGFEGFIQRKNGKNEGVTIFYRKSTTDFGGKVAFNLKATVSIQIPDEVEKHYRHQQDSDRKSFPYGSPSWRFIQNLMNRPGVGLSLLLEEERTKNMFWVATTHLYWHPHEPDIKSAQCALLCKELEEQCLLQVPAPLIFTGDFNSLPMKLEADEFDPIIPKDGLRSGVYEICTTGKLLHSHPHHPIVCCGGKSDDDPKSTQPEHDDDNENNHFKGYNTVDLLSQLVPSNTLELIDVFDTPLLLSPFYTNYTHEFKGHIDHIFYSNAKAADISNRLRLLQILDGYSEEVLSQFIALPSKLLPSDHIPLVAIFALEGNDGGDESNNQDAKG
mmetsp:Transcript_32842/g.42183  ORF Transcript_32842/g.42183 Transcript_32842/m.42183 type:complete len:463 (+) Transcript_32842:18-1406(+)